MRQAGKTGKEPSSLQPCSPGPAHYHVRDTVIRRRAHSPPAWQKPTKQRSQKGMQAPPAQGPVATSLLNTVTLNPRMSISITEDFEEAGPQSNAQPSPIPAVSFLQGTSAFKVAPATMVALTHPGCELSPGGICRHGSPHPSRL